MDNSPDVQMDIEMGAQAEVRIRIAAIGSDLHALLAKAHRLGVIVRVDTVSIEPLAMRNVRMVGHVRGAR